MFSAKSRWTSKKYPLSTTARITSRMSYGLSGEGGTIVSSALDLMMDIIQARYPASEWNIYAAQASDGENFHGDSERCVSLLTEQVMPLCQYYAYVEILDERETELFMNPNTGAALWRNYQQVGSAWPNFAMKRVASPGDIYPVFHELFAKQTGSKG